MTSLSEEEENLLEDKGIITIKRGKVTFTIEKKNVYCYGEIDFNTNSDDYDKIAVQNWFDDTDFSGVSVPSNYNYKDNVITSDIQGGRWYDTTRAEVITQYYHGVLGKPKRTIIFKQNV